MEDFRAATQATLSSSLRTPSHDWEVMDLMRLRSSFWEKTLVRMSGVSKGTHLGVLRPFVQMLMQMMRTLSQVKWSWQNGQVGGEMRDLGNNPLANVHGSHGKLVTFLRVVGGSQGGFKGIGLVEWGTGRGSQECPS
jgi:hypothetical protein